VTGLLLTKDLQVFQFVDTIIGTLTEQVGQKRSVNTVVSGIALTSFAGQASIGVSGLLNCTKASRFASPTKSTTATVAVCRSDREEVILSGGGFGESSITR
jgi:hypothetical protein